MKSINLLALSSLIALASCGSNSATNEEAGQYKVRVRTAYNTSYHALLNRYTGIAMMFIRKK